MHFFSQYRGLRRENYVLFFGRIVTNMGSMVWPMLTMILNQKLGMSAGNIAILTAVFGILMMPATLFGGKLADRLNKKNIIIVGDIVSVVCYILCGCVPLGMGTIVLMFVASLFQTIEGPAYNAIIADITSLEERDKAYSLLYWGANLGLVLSPTLSGLLFKNYLWLAFIISGVAIGCSTILIWFFVRDITPVEQIGSRAEYQRARDGESIFAILRQNPTILLYLAVSALCNAPAYDQYGYLMPLDLGRIHGENGAVIYGTVSSLNCIVVVLFTPFITRLFRRVIDTKKLLTGKLCFWRDISCSSRSSARSRCITPPCSFSPGARSSIPLPTGRISPRAPRLPIADASTAYPAWRIPSCAAFSTLPKARHMTLTARRRPGG